MDVINYDKKKVSQLIAKLEKNITPRKRAKIRKKMLCLFDADTFKSYSDNGSITDEKLIQMAKRIANGENPKDLYRELFSENFI